MTCRVLLPILLASTTLLAVSAAAASPAANGQRTTRTSEPIEFVLRKPLPPEELSLSRRGGHFIITGPTFTYHVAKSTGAITKLRVRRDGVEVISANAPAEILIDDYGLGSDAKDYQVSVLAAGKDKILIQARGALRAPNAGAAELEFQIVHTFYNDGVVVSAVKLIPRADFPVRSRIAFQLPAQGEFTHYLHKRRDEHGGDAARGELPNVGGGIRFANLTSCLSVYSPAAALAIFTDGGAIHSSQAKLDTAAINIKSRKGTQAELSLAQYVVHVAPGDPPFVLKSGEEFSFRTGISVAPNRWPHPRTSDLRMFIWIGDEKFPYPTDEEITRVAQWGYTVFQLHRAGTPGEPRPPAGEFDRVLRKVHELGMLYVWEENADLMYDSAPGVQELKSKGQWSRWQGFNYGGLYTATMDPYCTLAATCLASPNGLDEYRLANINRMLDRSPVDGIYLDDNLAYANCNLWREHGHPRPVYDSLIELHEMNWQRRELLRRRIPHALLISHNTKAFVLPILADFDVQYFAEGYCFASVAEYWENYRAWSLNLNAQAMICPGDDEGARCGASAICNYDWLTGGGQYSQMDWRLFPAKFKNYAGGVTEVERINSQHHNLAQYYFGMHESRPHLFANSTNLFVATTPGTFASGYRNERWGDWLFAVANMNPQAATTAVEFRSARSLGILPEKEYLMFDVRRRTARHFRGNAVNQIFGNLEVPGQNVRVLSVKEMPARSVFHIWGGKRISEQWNAWRRELTLTLQGPAGLRDTIFLGGKGSNALQVIVNGEPVAFLFDPAQGLAHGEVTFTSEPLKVEIRCSSKLDHSLPNATTAPDALEQLVKPPGK